MPNLSVLRAFSASKLSTVSKAIPVGVFVGGTSGIGQGMAEAFAKHTNGNAHIIIIGRNRERAETIISTFPKGSSPQALHEFVECDVTLMSKIQETSSSILARVPKINYPAYSAGLMTTAGRTETVEGIDRKLAVHYYGRWKFVNELMPALVKAKEEGEDARALFVLSAGYSAAIDLQDLGLKKTYSLQNAGGQASAYNDHMIQELAQRYPTLSFGHAHPGAVRSNLLSSSDSALLRWTSPLMSCLPFSASIAESGEYMLYGMLNLPQGWGGVGSKGQVVEIPVATEEARKALWEHTVSATGSTV